jgi:DNA mismatch endonuclease (patch repair protein)
MTDQLTPEQRSWNMAQIKGKDTKPELLVRSLLHRAGYRFTVNGPQNRKLPGKPDIVLPKFKTIIFVHGCFWHRHKGCKYTTTPKSNVEFWERKFQRNITNDRKNQKKLKERGWKVIIVWQCELKDPFGLIYKVETALRNKQSNGSQTEKSHM